MTTIWEFQHDLSVGTSMTITVNPIVCSIREQCKNIEEIKGVLHRQKTCRLLSVFKNKHVTEAIPSI